MGYRIYLYKSYNIFRKSILISSEPRSRRTSSSSPTRSEEVEPVPWEGRGWRRGEDEAAGAREVPGAAQGVSGAEEGTTGEDGM